MAACTIFHIPVRLGVSFADEPKTTMPNNDHRLSVSRSGNASSRRSAARFELEAGYRAMAADDDHEREALAWIEGLVGDVADDPVNSLLAHRPRRLYISGWRGCGVRQETLYPRGLIDPNGSCP
jgi:hypothetical protein